MIRTVETLVGTVTRNDGECAAYRKGCHEPCYWEPPASPEVKARIRESNTTLDNVKEL